MPQGRESFSWLHDRIKDMFLVRNYYNLVCFRNNLKNIYLPCVPALANRSRHIYLDGGILKRG